jgi:probable HAF family extracellular repeat protein
MKDLGTLPDGIESRALGITDDGQVVGFSVGSTGRRAFIWDSVNGMQDLNVLLEEECQKSGRMFTDARAIKKNMMGDTLIATRHGDGGCIIESVKMSSLGN